MSDYCVVQISVEANRNVSKMLAKASRCVWDAIGIREIEGSVVTIGDKDWKQIEICISELDLGESLEILDKLKTVLNIKGRYFVVYGLI